MEVIKAFIIVTAVTAIAALMTIFMQSIAYCNAKGDLFQALHDGDSGDELEAADKLKVAQRIAIWALGIMIVSLIIMIVLIAVYLAKYTDI